MPIPAPVAEESDKDFLTRCMDDDVMKDEFPDSDQRMAVCSVQAKYDGNEDLEALAVTAAKSAEEHAASLIKAGKITDGGSWSGPSTGAENRFLEDNSWEEYGNWFLGRKDGADPESKAHYAFPFSDDFKTVNRRGLNAIRSRAAQNDDQSVFEAAGRLIDLWPQTEARSNEQRICFQRKALKKKGRYLVNQKTGQMSDVSLIQVGEAKGHGMWIDQESLETALEILEGSTLPAYVTHNGAMESDRLLSEVGVFSGFYLEGGKVKAEQFKALDSFMADESERYRRLFDLAEAMPDAFGLSLVFEADLVWVQDDGQEASIEEGSPENSLRDLPSVRFKSIKSADFVDAPAANEGGLFSKNAKTNLILEGPQMAAENKTEDVVSEETSEEVLEDIQLEEAPEEESMEQKMAKKIEELEARLEEQATQISDLQGSLEASEAKAAKLSSLVSGQEALAEGDDSDPAPSILEQFAQATGGTQTRIWKQNKKEILRSARG